MKTTNLSYSLFFFLVLFTSSNALAESSMELEIKPGFNLSTHRGNLGDYFSTLLSEIDEDIIMPIRPKFGKKGSFTVGAGLRINLTDNFTINPEVIYSQKKSTLGYEVFLASFTLMEINYKYLDLPILARWRFPLANNVLVPNVYAGTTIGVLLASDYTFPLLGGIISNQLDNYFGLFNDNTGKLNISITGGLGLGINAGSGVINFDFRYNHGLLNVLEGSLPIVDTEGKTVDHKDVTIQTSNMSFYMGYSFFIKK